MRLFGLLRDNGDGSSSIVWTTSEEVVEKLLDDDYDPDTYYANEGSPACCLTLPDDYDLEATGIYVQTLEDFEDNDDYL